MKIRAAILGLLLLPIACFAQNTSTFGTITRADSTCTPTSCVYYQVPDNTPWVMITVDGTWSGILQVQTITGPNASYQNINSQTWSLISTLTANGNESVAVGSARLILVNAGTFTSGAAKITMSSSQSGSPLSNPVFSGKVGTGGVQSPDGGNSADCWATDGTKIAGCNGIGGVSQILPGANVSVDPPNGVGIVTVSASPFGGTLDTDNFLDQYKIVENGGVTTVGNGADCFGDSNMVGFGLPGGFGWAALLSSELNLPYICASGFRGQPFPLTGGNGDNSSDAINRLIELEFPGAVNNPLLVVDIGSNDIDQEGSATPSTAHQISFTSHAAGMTTWSTTGPGDKFLPSQTVATATSCSVANGIATVIANNQFVANMTETLSGFTHCTQFNTLANGIVTLTSATPTQYQFATTAATITSGSDTGIATPSNIWTFPTGTWAFQQPQTFFGGNNAVGAGYQTGNILTFASAAGGTPEVFTVVGTPGTGFGTGLTVTVTVDGGGHPNAVTSFSGGTAYRDQNGAQIQCGANDSYVQTGVTNIGTGVPTSVTILVPGSGGCSAGTYSVSTANSLSLGNFHLTSLGGRLASSAGIAVSCANGSASSCGAGVQMLNYVGPNAMYTTTGGTATLASIMVPQSAPAGTNGKGHVHLIYMAGPLNTGPISVVGSVDGALTDSITGLSTLPETNTGGFAPNNYQTGATMNDADFAVTPGTQTFTVTCAANCGFMALIVMPNTHGAGNGVPTLEWGGVLQRGNNIGMGSCGLTLPVDCATFYTQLGFTEINKLAAEGARVKPFSLESVSIVTDFTIDAGNAFVQGCVGNFDPTHAHLDSCGQQKVVNSIIQAMKLVPNASTLTGAKSVSAATITGTTSGTFPGMLYTFSSVPNGTAAGFGESIQQLSSLPSVGLSGTFANVAFQAIPNHATLEMCTQPFSAGNAVTITTLIASGACQFDFINNRFEIGGVAHATSGANSTSGTEAFYSSGWNFGEAFTQSSNGSGYSSTGTVTATGGTCTVQPGLFGTVSAGGLVITVRSAGICTVASTGFTVSGFGGGTGAAGTFALAATDGITHWDQRAMYTTEDDGNTYPTIQLSMPVNVPTSGLAKFQVINQVGSGYSWLDNNLTGAMLTQDNNSLTQKRHIHWADADGVPALFTSGAPVNNDCVSWAVAGSVATLADSGHPCNVLVASLTTTGATTDNVTLTGMTSSGHCTLGATNTSAATNIATTFISAKTTNQITVTHTATSGMTYDLHCTSY